MSKVKHVVALRGVISTSTGAVIAKTHQAKEVEEFHGDTPKGVKPFVASYFKLSGYKDESTGEYCALFLTTPKGKYELKFNAGAGIWQCTANGRKLHVSLKKVVGELRYWA